MHTRMNAESLPGRWFLIPWMVCLIMLVSSCVPDQEERPERIPFDDEIGPSADEIDPGASFRIAFDNVHRCMGSDFVTAEVVNTGTVAFVWADMELGWYWEEPDLYAGSEGDVEYHEQEKPFMQDPTSCPQRRGWGNPLLPQQSAYVGVQLHLPRSQDFYDVLEWENITILRLCAWLSPSDYPSGSGAVRECVDISHLLEDLQDQSQTGPATRTPLPPRPRRTPTPTPVVTIVFNPPTPISIGPPNR